MRGHALHALLVALPSLTHRCADLGAPREGELAGAPQPVRPPPTLADRTGDGADEGTTEGAVSGAPYAVRPRHRFPSGGYQVHNGRATGGALVG